MVGIYQKVNFLDISFYGIFVRIATIKPVRLFFGYQNNKSFVSFIGRQIIDNLSIHLLGGKIIYL